MSSTWFTWPDGSTWMVTHCGEFVFSDSDVEGLTAEEIGQRVLSLIPRLRRAGPYMNDWQYHRQRPEVRKYDKAFVFENTLENAEAWAAQEAQRVAQRELARERSPQIRKEIRANYDRYFRAIGRRDGFHCQQCHSTYDLTIDHIVAVINGGTNALDNLRLLCEACNGTKSDKPLEI